MLTCVSQNFNSPTRAKRVRICIFLSSNTHTHTHIQSRTLTHIHPDLRIRVAVGGRNTHTLSLSGSPLIRRIVVGASAVSAPGNPKHTFHKRKEEKQTTHVRRSDYSIVNSRQQRNFMTAPTTTFKPNPVIRGN